MSVRQLKSEKITNAANKEAEKMRVRRRRYEQRLHKIRRRMLKKNPFFNAVPEQRSE